MEIGRSSLVGQAPGTKATAALSPAAGKCTLTEALPLIAGGTPPLQRASTGQQAQAGAL